MEMCGKQVLRGPLLTIARGRTELGNDSAQIPGLVVPVMKYFTEKRDSLMIQMESTTTKGDDRKKDLPTTPVLIACGRCLQHRSGCWPFTSAFVVALGILFSSYYCFSIEYNADAAATLDFTQKVGTQS
ncbi:hypothetical protein HOLleu_43687 [Holothuria leucospilota]|uniref:Uncharacterized protein n=1 Tax=Holothuria leucospilota TaxID=206669 RepID=A0A9Q0Y9D8_HOLLE|nr:hypothetical protein HOLleu_43687 [Holothuria leucospilota]